MPAALEGEGPREKPCIEIARALPPHAGINPLRFVVLEIPVKRQRFIEKVVALLWVH